MTGSGTTTIPTSLAPTINLPSSTANETLSFDASQTENQFILLNNSVLTPGPFARNHLLFQNVQGYGFDLSSDSDSFIPQGTFQLLFYTPSSATSVFLVNPSIPSIVFNVEVQNTQNMDMGNRQINNLVVAGSPALSDAVNVQYVNNQISAGTVTLTGGVTGTGLVNGSIVTTVATTSPLPSSNFICYVNKGGNDSTGNGTIGAPFLTVSHAMSTITYATSSQNVQIVVGPGTYSNAFSLKANVDIVGQQTDRTTLSGTIDLNDASWNNANDNRSSLIDITIGAAITLDFTVQNATAGKFYLNGVTFNSTFAIIGYNAINQLIARNNLFFNNYTQTGVTAILDSSTNLGGVTTLLSSTLAANPTSLTLYGGGSSGNLVVTYTSTNAVNATTIGCAFVGGMSASGAQASISYTTGTVPFPTGIVLSGGATSTKLTS